MESVIDTPIQDTTDAFLGQLRLTRRLTAVRQIVRLALIPLLGLMYLLGGPIEAQLGSFTLVSVLLATFGLGLTLLEVLELLGGSSERGGTFDLVAETMGGIGSFLTGWSLLAAETLLVAALITPAWDLIQAGFEIPLPRWIGSLLLLALLAISQLFPFDRRRRLRNWLTNLLMFGLAAVLLTTMFSQAWSPPSRPASVAAEPLWRIAGRLAFLFLAVESVLVARRQMRRERVSVIQSIVWVLAAGGFLILLVYLVVSGLWSGGEVAVNWQSLMSNSLLPVPMTAALITLTLLLSARAILTLASRNVYDMSRLGALPSGLRTARRPFSAPPLLVLAPLVPITVWIILGSWMSTLELASALMLAVAFFVSVAGLYSRRAEPERRRKLTLPLYPLAPALAIMVVLSFFLNLGAQSQLLALGWLLLGTAVYFSYARRRQVEAQEGLSLFVGEKRLEKEEGTYRILVPLAAGEHRHFILQLAVGLAKQLHGDVLPLQIIPVPDPLAMAEARRLAQERNTLFHWSTRLASQAGVAIHPITRLARTVPEGILDTAVEEETDLLLIPWVMADDPETGQMGAVLDPVIAQSPCDTAVVAYRPTSHLNGEEPETAMEASSQTIDKILVPTAGGPHAPLAVGLGLLLAREFKAKVSSVYVAETSASDSEIRAGEDRIRATLVAMEERAAEALHQEQGFDLFEGTEVETRVILAEDVVEGIAQASQEADLALIGASEESFIDQVLFGNLPRQVAAACQTPIIMVRRYRGLPHFWLRRIWESMSKTFPTLQQQDQIDLYKRVRRGARPDIDFFIMMGLSAVIATLGLLLNSGAVIIGAMLVAPLFTPILAFSLAIAMGDIRLIRLAVESSLKGIFLAIGLALVLAFLAPLPVNPLTLPEIAGRVQPNLLDLGVALAAGAAGAYAIARRDVAAALPGVAIAAALVPPLSVVGIALAAGQFGGAAGASLLVVTNLIAISLAGAVTLLLLGFRPAPHSGRTEHLRTGLVATLILSIVISIPLAAVLIRTARQSATQQAVTNALQVELEAVESVELGEVTVSERNESLFVTATLYYEDGQLPVSGEELVMMLEQTVDREIKLRLLTIPLKEYETP